MSLPSCLCPGSPVAADPHRRAIDARGADLVERIGHLQRRPEVEAVHADIRHAKRGEIAGVASMGPTMGLLPVVEAPQRPCDCIVPDGRHAISRRPYGRRLYGRRIDGGRLRGRR